eukprot:253649_1
MHQYMNISIYESTPFKFHSLYPKHSEQVLKFTKQIQDLRDKTTIKHIQTAENIQIGSCRCIDTECSSRTRINIHITLLKNNKRILMQICHINWSNKMYKWNPGDWCLFYLYAFKKYNINTVNLMSMSYKIQNIPFPDFASKCNKAIDILFNTQWTSFKSFFKYDIKITPDFGFLKDSALFFDCDTYVYSYLKTYLNVILEDKKKYPAFSYVYPGSDGKKRFVMDRNLKIFSNQKK